MSWVNVGVAAASAVGGIAASNKASDASVKGSKNALALQQRMYDTGLALVEPQRALGYGALSDIASLYGYGLPAYPTAATNYGAPITVKGTSSEGRAGFEVPNPAKPLGFTDPVTSFLNGSDKPTSYGGTIDPRTGTVDVQGAGARKDALLTNYLRTGEWTGGGGKRLANLRGAVDKLREGGYEYGKATPAQTPGPTGQAGNMSRFFASPDYEFRRSEGLRGIEQGAAARGGALSGNALRATTDFSSNLASGEFGNYMNRLFNIAGMGQTATGSAVNSGQQYANAGGALQQQMGDTRASGVMGAYNSGANALNSGYNNYLLQKGGWFDRPNTSGVSAPASSYGPYAGGYLGLQQTPAPWRYTPNWNYGD